MRMIGIKENWDVVFPAHGFHKRCEFICPPKISLSFRRANHYRNSDLVSGCNYCLQQHQIGNIEMA